MFLHGMKSYNTNCMIKKGWIGAIKIHLVLIAYLYMCTYMYNKMYSLYRISVFNESNAMCEVKANGSTGGVGLVSPFGVRGLVDLLHGVWPLGCWLNLQ